MSDNISSTQNVHNLKDLIERIPTRGVPSKVTIKYLEGLGYKSNNDRPIISVLKSINILDSNGTPNDNYNKLRSPSRKQDLAELIKEAYKGLFSIYPNANTISDEKLKDYFASVTSVGEASLKNIIKTFQALCSIADFSNTSNLSPSQPSQKGVINPKSKIPDHFDAQNNIPKVHFNIQVHIPGEQSPETYEAIFKNLGKYVLGINDNEK